MTLVLRGSSLSNAGILGGIDSIDRAVAGTLQIGNTVATNVICVSSGSTVSGSNAVVVGGSSQSVSVLHSVIVGGSDHVIDTNGKSCILGGQFNHVSGLRSATIAGGGTTIASRNTASGSDSVIIGGSANTASGNGAIILGGSNVSATGVNGIVLNGHNGVMTIGHTNHVLIKDTLFYSPVSYNGSGAGETFTAANFAKGIISMGNGFSYTSPTAANLATEFGVNAATFASSTNRVIFEVIFKLPTDTDTATLSLGAGVTYVNVPAGAYTITGGVIMKFEFVSAATVHVTVVGAGSGGGGGATLNWVAFTMDTPVSRFTSFSNESSEYLNIDFVGATLNVDLIALTDLVAAVGQSAVLDIPVATGIPCIGTAGVKYTGYCIIEEVTALAITGTTVANPTVITVASHTFVAGDPVAVTGNGSITESSAYTVQAFPAPTGTTFAINFNNLTGLSGGFVIGLNPVSTQFGSFTLDSNVNSGNRITIRTNGSFAQNTRYRIKGQVTYKI